MKLVRFTQRAFVDDHLYEAGETAVISDEHVGEHIVDLAAASAPSVSGVPPVPLMPVGAPASTVIRPSKET